MIKKDSCGFIIFLIITICVIMVACNGAKNLKVSTSVAIERELKANPTDKVSRAETCDITLTWDDVQNAVFYNIYWSDKPGVTKKNGTKISKVKNPLKIEGLVKGKTYYFVVTAVNDLSESKESEEISIIAGQ